jgi:hypothetical protein
MILIQSSFALVQPLPEQPQLCKTSPEMFHGRVVRASTVYSTKFTLVRINKLLIAYHLNIPIYQLSVSVCPATFP